MSIRLRKARPKSEPTKNANGLVKREASRISPVKCGIETAVVDQMKTRVTPEMSCDHLKCLSSDNLSHQGRCSVGVEAILVDLCRALGPRRIGWISLADVTFLRRTYWAVNGVYSQLARGILDQIDSIPSDQRLHVGMNTHLVYCVKKGKRYPLRLMPEYQDGL